MSHKIPIEMRYRSLRHNVVDEYGSIKSIESVLNDTAYHLSVQWSAFRFVIKIFSPETLI